MHNLIGQSNVYSMRTQRLLKSAAMTILLMASSDYVVEPPPTIATQLSIARSI
jgi:hypothetical protein